MSHTLDVLTDVEHGTVEGYRQGCRTSHCPAGEFGLSCIRANTLAAGNWQYLKAVQRGLTPREVAELLGLTAPVAVVAVKEEKVMSKKVEAGKPSQKDVRAWARSVGIDVPARGTLPRAVVEAYQARGKGVQASDVKPMPAVEPEPIEAEPVAEEPAEDANEGAEIASAVVEIPSRPKRADWALPLTAYDLRAIADALDALSRVPLNIVDIESLPVVRPGGIDAIGDFRLADDDDEVWIGFVPRGAA